ncbi:MAG: sodium:solute symporter family protein [Bacteroidota bacterium]
MHWIDVSIFVLYMIAMLGIGYYFLKRNKSTDDFYVGGRSMGAGHVGLSVVATDVGGGFSIGLGGLGFAIGISGSWMLFTGLLGAWLAGVFLVPLVYRLGVKHNFYTFPQMLNFFYDKRVAMIAGIISGIGYIGFTSSQVLAGAKLASATFIDLNLNTALVFMGIIAVVYTVMGGLKAVIYTDTVQWIILIAGLTLIGIPVAGKAVGGWAAVKATLPAEFLQFDNLSWQRAVKWVVTILPIWFVGMTLYQRIYASKDAKSAKRAWFLAGIFEYPFMAFMGVILGIFARVAFENGMFAEWGYQFSGEVDVEMGLPIVLRNTLPIGLMGLMMSAYFSAIMSTADSCLMAASGNLLSDIGMKLFKVDLKGKKLLRASQLVTLLIGVLAILIALNLQNVLELMLYSYAFMVSGLFIPVLVALIYKKPNASAAIVAMLGGGSMTVALTFFEKLPFGLDANVFGLIFSAILYFSLHYILKSKGKTPIYG